MDLELAGEAALVTGGSRGIGLRTARVLAAEGFHLGLCARNEDDLGRGIGLVKNLYAGTEGAKVVLLRLMEGNLLDIGSEGLRS